MHIYINGERLGRTYTPSYHLAELPAGEVTVELRLASNDHSDFEIDGELVARATVDRIDDRDTHVAGEIVGADGEALTVATSRWRQLRASG